MRSFSDSIYTSYKEGRKEEAVAKAFLIVVIDILITILMAVSTNVIAVILTIIALVIMDIHILLKIRNQYKEDNCIE